MPERYKDIKYEPVDEPSQRLPSSRGSLRRLIFSFLAGCGVSLLIAATGAAIYKSTLLHSKEPVKLDAKGFVDAPWNDCGRSSKVAIERGCVMEPLFYGFFPKQCVYQELTRQNDVFADRKYYLDLNLTQEVPRHELYKGVHNPVYTGKYHDEHCLYGWRKLQYAMEHNMQFVDPKMISVKHEEHCVNQLSESCEPSNSRATIELGFYRCRLASWAKS